MKFSLLLKTSLILLLLLFSPYWLANLAVFGSAFDTGLARSSGLPRTVMVLGAGLRADMPTQILQRRLDSAANLYDTKLVDNILLSGSNPEQTHNEPQVMRRYLINFRNIPSSKIFMDFGGRRTFDSCWRARNVFKLSKIYLTTQAYHLGRSTFLCRSLGLETIPVIADNVPRAGRDLIYGIIREIGASWEALSNLLNRYVPPIRSDGSEPTLI